MAPAAELTRGDLRHRHHLVGLFGIHGKDGRMTVGAGQPEGMDEMREDDIGLKLAFGEDYDIQLQWDLIGWSFGIQAVPGFDLPGLDGGGPVNQPVTVLGKIRQFQGQGMLRQSGLFRLSGKLCRIPRSRNFAGNAA